MVALAVIAIAFLVGTYLLARGYSASASSASVPATVPVSQVTAVVAKLDATRQNGNFIVVMFVPAGSSDGVAVNLQWSVEGGKTGLDWVLLSPRNVADQDAIRQFAKSAGFVLQPKEMNGVHYLRAEGRGVDGLGVKILEGFYKLSPDSQVELLTEGIDWP